MMNTQLYRRLFILPVFFLLSASLFFATFAIRLLHPPLQNAHQQKQSASLLDTYGKLPLAFEANQGQAESGVRFLAHSNGSTLYLTATDSVLALGNQAKGDLLRLHLTGSNLHPQVDGLDALPGTSNYLLGNDSRLWHTHVPTYARVVYQEVYPGVNLVYSGNQGHLEYAFVLARGANPQTIVLSFAGMEHMHIDAAGDLILHMGNGDIRQAKPLVYQEVGGVRQLVAAQYVLTGPQQISFAVSAYDPGLPLIIDPTLTYSTYLGGNGYDYGHSIAVDSAGNAYVTGYTTSTNFPSAHALQSTFGGGNYDAFVTKLNASGSAFIYSTYLGGNGDDVGNGIAVDSAGNAYVTGYTGSTNFPIANALQGTLKGTYNAFVTKLDASGSALLYSTYLGGSNLDEGLAIALDSAGNAYVTGYTNSTNFPTQHALQATNAGSNDAFVTKLNTTGSALVYSTYLGGSADDYGAGIAVDSTGNVYVTGQTDSTNFPTFHALQKHNGGKTYNAFVTKLNASGSAFVYSTYLGGNGYDVGSAIATDSAGDAYVTGSTNSTNFPITKDALQGTLKGTYDAFVSKLNASGSAFVYSTYLGGNNQSYGRGIAADSAGNAYITGQTGSTDFPIANAVQATNAGSDDAFVSELNALGGALVYSTFLGGTNSDGGWSIAVDSVGNAYITGYTGSSDFPTRNPIQGTFGGNSDAFIAKIAP